MSEDYGRQQPMGQQGMSSSPREPQAQQYQQPSGQQWGNSATDQDLMAQVREHMDVIGPDGQRVGRVDGVEGDRIKLTRQDSPDGEHRYVSASEIAGIEDGAVRLASDDAIGGGSQRYAEADAEFGATGMANSGNGFASGQ